MCVYEWMAWMSKPHYQPTHHTRIHFRSIRFSRWNVDSCRRWWCHYLFWRDLLKRKINKLLSDHSASCSHEFGFGFPWSTKLIKFEESLGPEELDCRVRKEGIRDLNLINIHISVDRLGWTGRWSLSFFLLQISWTVKLPNMKFILHDYLRS